jgi:hypothetical protein
MNGDSAGELSDRRIQLPLVSQGDPELAVGEGGIRRGSDRVAECALGRNVLTRAEMLLPGVDERLGICFTHGVLCSAAGEGGPRERMRRDLRAGVSRGKAVLEVMTMPQETWSRKRERQYEHIRNGLIEQGRRRSEAEEIAARTVNKARARSGESREASRASLTDISSARRGGLRSHRGPGGRTFDQLYEEARDLGIKGRSKMNKAELKRAVNRRSGR